MNNFNLTMEEFAEVEFPNDWITSFARRKWLSGDWNELSKVDLSTIENHQNRAELALLTGTALLQTEHKKKGKIYIQKSKEWGMDEKIIIQYLISGAYNSIGRANIICAKQEIALKNFNNAISSVQSAKNDKENSLIGLKRYQIQNEEIEKNKNILKTEKSKKIADENLEKQEISIKIDEKSILQAQSKIPEEDFICEKFDTQNHKSTEKILIIFSTPRSGSTLLCDLLYQNKLCTAHEYFQPYQYLPILANRWQCIDKGYLLQEKYATELQKKRTNSNGWLGINIHGDHLPIFLNLKKHFGDIEFKYIFLKRKDLLQQAISLAIASKTGIWSSHFKKNESHDNLRYNFKEIEIAKIQIERENQKIQSFLELRKINFYNMQYEEMTSNWEIVSSVIADIFETKKNLQFKTQLQIQRNDNEKNWRRFYNNEILDLENLRSAGSVTIEYLSKNIPQQLTINN